MKKKYSIPSYISISVFVVCMVAVFGTGKGTMDWWLWGICLAYSFVCCLFLVFQLYAFYKAHTEYHEEVENIKYKVFEAEGIPLTEVECDG